MNLAQRLVHNLKAAFLLDQPLDAEIAQTNIRRIILMFYIMAPVHIAQIFIFWQALNRSTTSTTDTFITWRMGIIYAHSTMLVLIVTTVLLAHVIKRKEIENNRFGRAVPIIIAFSYLLFGATVCIIDQLVTPSIAPYLLVSVAVATVILVHPFFAGIIYISVYFFYYIFLPLTQLNSELLLSSRVNSLSAGGIGLGLSLILWRSNALSLFQKRAIEIQKHELEKKNIQLEQISRTDMLTGLYNRMCFTDFTEREVTRIKRTGETACLIFFDLDHFKNVNDHYGHPNGDVVLRRVSEVTKTQLRETDILARFGGEEFSILLPDTLLAGAALVAEKIRQAIEKCSFDEELEDLHLTASFGVASLGQDETVSFDNAYKKADKALYRAKQKGRNRVECAT